MSCITTARSSCVVYAFTFVGPFPQLCFSAPVMALQIVIAAGPSMVPRSGPRCVVLAVGDASGFALTASLVTVAMRVPFYGSGRGKVSSGWTGHLQSDADVQHRRYNSAQ